MTTSFPYFSIARSYGVDYAKVLHCVARLEGALGQGARVQMHDEWETWGLPRDVVAALCEAVIGEHRRRQEALADKVTIS